MTTLQVFKEAFLLPLLVCLVLPHPGQGALTLKPQTQTVKEVFTGDSFVITCLSDGQHQPSNEFSLKWINPDGREVLPTPTAPIYVSEKPDGLQIVFLRHNKKHSGLYKCLQVRARTGQTVDETPFEVKIYKSIEFHGSSPAIASEGEVFSVICNARFDSDVTSASVVWDKNGRDIVNENSNKYYVSESRPPNLKSTLHIKDVDKWDAGYYTCRATQFTPTISQFKQHEVLLRVHYKPKFPANTPTGVWIDRHEFSKGLSFIDVNFTCIVDADPGAELSWHTGNRRLVEVGVTDGVGDIVTKENMSILRYRYRVTGEEVGREDRVSTGNWPINPYQKPNRKSQINQPNVQFECRAKNQMGSDARNFPLRIGDLPTMPTLISHSYEGNNLTLVLQQTPVDPPVDFYRIDFSDGIIVEFNSSSLVQSEESGSVLGLDEGNNNLTYRVALDNVPSGRHRPILYAHNPVGWSPALRDPAFQLHVINGVSCGHASAAVVVFSILFVVLSSLFDDKRQLAANLSN